MALNSGSGGSLVVAMLGEAFFKEIVSKDARLGKAVYTTVDFEVNPTIS